MTRRTTLSVFDALRCSLQLTELFGDVAHRMPLQLVEPTEKMINKDIRYRPSSQLFMLVSIPSDVGWGGEGRGGRPGWGRPGRGNGAGQGGMGQVDAVLGRVAQGWAGCGGAGIDEGRSKGWE